MNDKIIARIADLSAWYYSVKSEDLGYKPKAQVQAWLEPVKNVLEVAPEIIALAQAAARSNHGEKVVLD